MKKIKNKKQIQNIIHYLIKWADWFSEYNFYELASHLADTLKTVADYEQKLKHKCKKISQININEILNSENIFCKQICWNEITWFFLINENMFLNFDWFFWVNYITFHLNQLLFLLSITADLLNCRTLLYKEWETF